MKHIRRQTERPRGLKSRDLIHAPEQPAESFFDIRKFLQSDDVEYMKMMATLTNPQPNDHKAFLSMSWLGRIDPELDKNLKESLGFKDYILQQFAEGYEEFVEKKTEGHQDTDPALGLAQAYTPLFLGIQTFPELRQNPQVQEKLKTDYPKFLKTISDPTIPLVDRIPMASVFSVLLPERKKELIVALLEPYGGQVNEMLAQPELQTGDDPTFVLGLLLFPEQAEQIKQLFRAYEVTLAKDWEVMSKKRKHLSEMEDYFNHALFLSLATAQRVIVSPDGQIKFELKPVPASVPTPLPLRPLN